MKGAPANTYFQVDYHQFVISSTSKHPDEAFQVIEAATSDEAQLEATKGGKLTVLKNAALKKQFAVNLPPTKGKNVAGIFKSQPAKLSLQTKFNNTVNQEINAAFHDVLDVE